MVNEIRSLLSLAVQLCLWFGSKGDMQPYGGRASIIIDNLSLIQTSIRSKNEIKALFESIKFFNMPGDLSRLS
jgi:hypothetical protein